MNLTSLKLLQFAFLQNSRNSDVGLIFMKRISPFRYTQTLNWRRKSYQVQQYTGTYVILL